MFTDFIHCSKQGEVGNILDIKPSTKKNLLLSIQFQIRLYLTFSSNSILFSRSKVILTWYIISDILGITRFENKTNSDNLHS